VIIVGENAQCLASAKSGSTKVPVSVGMDTLSSGYLRYVEKNVKVSGFPFLALSRYIRLPCL
jgi:hypothetical protein